MNILFDYDGTLHDTVKIYSKSFRRTYSHMVNLGLAKDKHLSDEHISSYLGYTPRDAWKKEIPTLSDNAISKCITMTGDYMNQLISSGYSELYDGVIDVITELKKQGHTLLILSNCTSSYKSAHLFTFNLNKWFDRFYAAEEFKYIPKHAIFEYIKNDYPGNYIVVGDRSGDINISSKNIIASIGCTYGSGSLGELKNATYLVDNVKDIPKVIDEILI